MKLFVQDTSASLNLSSKLVSLCGEPGERFRLLKDVYMYVCMYVVYSTKSNFIFLFCFYVIDTSLLVSIGLPLPMFFLTFFSAVKDTVTSIAWSEFVF